MPVKLMNNGFAGIVTFGEKRKTRKINVFSTRQNIFRKISTHLLTVLTNGVIFHSYKEVKHGYSRIARKLVSEKGCVC